MKVALFRDLPTEHWYSMERYADELQHWLLQFDCDVTSFVPVRPFPALRGTPNILLNYGWRSIVYPPAAHSHQRDINHIIDHSYAHLIEALDPNKTIVTCHDIAPLALNQGKGIARRLWDKSFRSMLTARCIITDSEFTRREILSHASYPKERIHVVPLGVSQEFFAPINQADALALRERRRLGSRRLILHVGSCEARKNVELILHALGDLVDLDVVFAQIGGYFSKKQLRLIDELNIRERVYQIPFVSEDDLQGWHQTADVFVFPSKYEGFGLPVLEAMASGTPVICARASSLPEVAGDAVLFTDPDDCAQLAQAIRAIMDDSKVTVNLVTRGKERAAQFTWERTARETLAVYREIANR